MINNMNKKASEKILSLWWILVLAVIGTVIVTAVGTYYSAAINVNSIEAEILAGRVLMCISDNGYLIYDFNQSYFFNNCSLDRRFFERGSNYFFKLSINNGSDFNVSYGDASNEANCIISEKVDAKFFAKCAYKKENLIDRNGNNIKIFILTSANQIGRKNV